MQPQRAPSGLSVLDEQPPVPRSAKKRRLNRPSVKVTSAQPKSLKAMSSAHRLSTKISPQQTSSGEMTPPGGQGSVKYTRTGRVSRANKGKRVHHCEECDRTYTRAEHLRRHQQNHKPGAFACNFPECTRSFHREDLLLRHQARHNEPDGSASPDHSYQSPSSTHSESVSNAAYTHGLDQHQLPTGVGIGTISIDPPSIAAPSGDNLGQHIPLTKYGSIPRIDHRRLAASSSIGVDGLYDHEPFEDFSDSSAHYTPNGYYSPHINYLTAQTYPPLSLRRTRQSSDASFLDYSLPPYASPSPASGGSSTMYAPQGIPRTVDGAYQYFDMTQIDEHLDSKMLTGYDQTFAAIEQFDPGYRDAMEQPDLAVDFGFHESTRLDLGLDGTLRTTEERYLAMYWSLVHPFFPVVHRPSFDMQTASPLLRAAVLALGAQASLDEDDKANARACHERCIKVLKMRTIKMLHSYRLCDMQAAVLVEVYSLFKSRRTPLQCSNYFADVYRFLANDHEALNTVIVECENTTHEPSLSSVEFTGNFFHATDAEGKQRLLLACHMLDQQQALLFGRTKIEVLPCEDESLPFPQSQASWDGIGSRRQSLADSVSWPVHNLGMSSQPALHMHDLFQSMHMLGSFFDSRRDAALERTFSPSDDLLHLPIVEQSSRIRLAYHTFMLCDNAPIRSLLAVAGETWVIFEKLASEKEYVSAKIMLRDWATEQDDPRFGLMTSQRQQSSVSAFQHALKILELHQSSPRTGLLFQEWAVFLASLVIWAKAYAHAGDGTQYISPVDNDYRETTPDLSSTIASLSARGANRPIRFDDSIRCLLWCKAKITQTNVAHSCGLVNAALGVLEKLLEKGTHPGWF